MDKKTRKIVRKIQIQENPLYVADIIDEIEENVENNTEEIKQIVDEIKVFIEEKKDLISGKDGLDGKDGKDGVNGVDGKDGKDGVDGKDGYTPIKGVDYFDGKDGIDGKDGKDGKDGIDGKDGVSPTSKEIIEEIKKLKGDERLDILHLKNGENLYRKLTLSRQQTVNTGDQRWHGGGGDISVKDDGTIITNKVTSFNFVGNGVTATSDANGNVTVTVANDGLYVRLDGSNTPMTGQLRLTNGTASLPSFSNTTRTDTGWYFSASGSSLIATVAGTSFVKIQPSPFRFVITQGAEAFVINTTFEVEDPDAGINLNRNIAAESFIATKSNTTGGMQQRGLLAGGGRWTTADGTTEYMRLIMDSSNGALAVNTTTPTAHFQVNQRVGSTIDVARFRANTGLNLRVESDSKVGFRVNDSVTIVAVSHINGGNSGGANTTAALGFSASSALTFNNWISTHHNGSNAAGNGFRFWTNNAVSAANFPSDSNIGFSIFGQRAGVGLQTPDAVFDIENAANAFGDLDDPTDYHLYLRNPADDTGKGIGIAFSIEASANFVGASIIHERTAQGSQGNLNFYTKRTTGAADPVLGLQLTDAGLVHVFDDLEVDGDINHDGSAIGFFGVTPAARTTAYTQTYATATRTQNNLTSQTLTDSTGGTPTTTVVAIVGTGDDANLNDNFADLIAQINALRVDLENVKQITNSILDDQQTYGFFQ